MPMRVTITATAIAGSAKGKKLEPMTMPDAECVNEAAIHQSRTVARDAHVPGPGPKYPMPKKVAIIHAHPLRVAGSTGLVAFVVIPIRFGQSCVLDLLHYFRIKNR
jgi:hypothetical protein